MMRKLIFLASILFCSTLTRVLPQSYLTHTYTFMEGMPSSTVFDIDQATNGVMWFATRGGVAQYDGFTWESHSQAIPKVQVRWLKADAVGNVWVSGRNLVHGLAMYDGDKWIQIPFTQSIPRENEISAFEVMHFDGENYILIGTDSAGIYLYDGNHWRHFTVIQGLPSNEIWQIKAVHSKFYILTKNGMCIYENTQITDVVFEGDSGPLESVKIFDVYVDSSDVPQTKFCFIDNQSIALYHDDKLVLQQPFPFASAKRVSDNRYPEEAIHDGVNGYYIANANGLFYFDEQERTTKKLGQGNGLLSERFDILFRDAEQNVWLGSWNGCNKIISKRFSNYRKINGLYKDEVTAFIEYKPGKFVFGHNNGITLYDGEHFQSVPFLSPRENANTTISRVIDLGVDNNGSIWASVNEQGLVCFTPHNEQTWYFKNSDDHMIPLAIDDQGNVWCVESGDLFKFENDQFVKIYNFEFDTSDAIRKLVIIDDRLFACSSKGLAYYEDGVEKLVQGPDPAAMNLYNVFKRSNGQILCGTLGGLYYLSGDSLVKFDELFHIDSPVYFILEDKDERLWFGTDRGVSRWNGSTLKHFSHLHGLAGHETNRSAGYLDSKNTVWIGTDHGISNYQPKYDSKPPVAPRLELTRVHVDSLDILETHQLNLEAGQNNIHIHVRCIAFTDEKNIKISYKLDGAGENWQVESPLLKPEIQYTNIAPGKYRFQIRAENVDGIQSEIVYSPYFRINLPLYKQAWFYALVAILFTSFVFLIYLQNSRRKQAELLKLLVDERTAELASTEQKLQEMFNQSRDIIFICSAKWDFLDINPAGLDIFGFEVKEKIFKKNFLLHLVENESERDKLRANIVQNGYIQNADVIVNSNSGSKVYLILSAYAVKDDNGEMTEIRCILKDVTERQQLTEQLGRAKRMESIGVLAGGIAHDFNNILSVIIGYADISLAEVAKESMLYKNIKAINDAAFRAKDLVRQILSFSRKKADEIKPVKVDSIVKEALKFLRSSIPSSIELISNIDKNIPHVLANPSQIHQVIMNLGTNAYQAIGEHVGKIHIELSCVEPSWDQNFNLKDGQYVMLKIKDSGNGMDPITLDKIFDPFFTTKPVGKGTGLGLSAVHGIIHSIGGTIQVTSEINVGSTFHVYLPVAKAEDIEEIAITNNIPGGNERILLVDDEVSVAKVVKQILSRLGYTVSVEHNSREALEHFKNDPFQYDLIITDQIMPEMTGLQLTKDILTIRPDMPIILTSGYSEKIDPDELRTLGIKGYIIKPATAREIAELIRQVMIKEIT